MSVSAVHSLQCCFGYCSAVIQSQNFLLLSSRSRGFKYCLEDQILTEVFFFSGFIRAPEVNPSLYFSEARFDVAASAQTDQQFCDFLSIREHSETGNSRKEAQKTMDLREYGVDIGKRCLGN